MKEYKSGKKIIFDKNKASQYEYFLPSYIDDNFSIKDQKIFVYLEKATKLLGELNAYGNLIPDVNFFIHMHIKSEAIASLKIEGTQTNMNEILLLKNDIYPEKKDDWQEVKNYIRAMNISIKRLSHLPISTKLIKETHEILLSGVRGENRMLGEIRYSQNWIGGSSINTAHFIPPHHTKLSPLLSDLEKFWHNENLNIPILIKIAIMHYQFETIHPFLDGNGRMGRVLISLQLIEKKFLKYPVLYISDFFETHRQAYYESLDRVRAHSNLEQWILFFLEAIIETSIKSQETFENILELREKLDAKICTLGKKTPNGHKLLLYLFSQPMVSVKTVENHLEIQYSTANNLIQNFVKLGILTEQTTYSRNRLFLMEEYVTLFEK